MAAPRYDVLGIGNAIFDILAHVDDDFIVRENLTKGSMRLVDGDEIARLYADLGQVVRISGGSGGNTIAGISSLTGKAAYIGKVADDEFGEAYRHDMRGVGVAFDTKPLSGGAPTASCLVLVTPDGERTMSTFLGACQALGPDDVDPALVADAEVTFLEGYLWDPADAKEAFRKAAEIAHQNGRKVALTLSDTFCVDRFRSEFLELIKSGTVDIVFANEHELRALYETSDFDSAVAALRQDAKLAAVTMGGEGSLTVTRDETHHVKAAPIDKIVDLTGAGDLYAGGFLFGLARGLPLPDCAAIGGIAAAEVIQHIGARPEVALVDLVRQAGFKV
ncbi:adenosine kinase [Amorphus orientalis]|uniref:Adenosine kinase n=1 Tax=Amorphus orientalis TaxID=649198 RepID=A0AAE4ASN2_9HYPH|nr:adenosine kinase [Amorphus orientalis]MDQ0315210.1 adenosine kinase [Amorphus orientalis]